MLHKEVRLNKKPRAYRLEVLGYFMVTAKPVKLPANRSEFYHLSWINVNKMVRVAELYANRECRRKFFPTGTKKQTLRLLPRCTLLFIYKLQ